MTKKIGREASAVFVFGLILNPSFFQAVNAFQTLPASRTEHATLGRNSLNPLFLVEKTIERVESEVKTEQSPAEAIECVVEDEEALTGNDRTYQWPLTIMALCWGITFLSSLDRIAMSVAILPLSTEFDFSETVKGQVSAFFSIGYGIAIIPCGLLLSFASPRIMMGAGIALWSLATIITPISSSMGMPYLLAARAGVGASESVVLPTIQRILSSWIPEDRKSMAFAIVYSGFQTGTVAAYLLSPYVIDFFENWRGVFYLYGAVGLLWLIPWFSMARDQPSTIGSADGGFAEPAADSAADKDGAKALSEAIDTIRSAPWRSFSRSSGVWAIVIAHAASNWGLYNNLSWTPTFCSEQYGLNVRDSAFFSILPSVAGAVGGFTAGATADRLIRSFENATDTDITRVRKLYQGIALYGPGICLAFLAFHIPERPLVAQSLLMGTVGLQAMNAAGYGPVCQEKAGEKWAGLLYSVTTLPGVAFGSLGVYLTGQILDYTNQNWSQVFALNAMVDILGATGFVLLYDGKKEFE